jgi:hypothetical protein
LFEAVSRGEFIINGFCSRDLRALLFADADASKHDRRRRAAVVSRQIALLRSQRLIRKIAGTHRYHLCVKGHVTVAALIAVRNVRMEALTKLAA